MPPGIGDTYWVLVKLKSFLEKNGLADPELTIVSHPDPLGGHLRGIPFLEMFPWIKLGSPVTVPNAPGLQDIWDEAYLGPGRSIFPGVMGYDYLIAYNGRVNSGGWIEDDEYACDWCILPQKHSYRSGSDMLLCFFPFYGTYESHERDFPISKIAESINQFVQLYDLRPVFIGAAWDQGLNSKLRELMAMIPNYTDMVGRTDLQQTLDLIQQSRMVVGYHAGITQMAAVMRKPTLLLWDDRYPLNTCYSVVPPYSRGTNYDALWTKHLTVDLFVQEMENTWQKSRSSA